MNPSEQPKFRTLTTLNAGRTWSNENSHSLPVEVQNGIATLEDGLATVKFFSFQKKHKPTTYSYHMIQQLHSLVFTQRS